MDKEKLEHLGLLLVATFLGSLGQLFFKYAFNSPGGLALWLFLGFVMYGISTLFYFTVLSRVHLSWTYGMSGLGYVFTVIFAAFVLSESIPLQRWFGVGVIFLGVVLIGLS